MSAIAFKLDSDTQKSREQQQIKQDCNKAEKQLKAVENVESKLKSDPNATEDVLNMVDQHRGQIAENVAQIANKAFEAKPTEQAYFNKLYSEIAANRWKEKAAQKLQQGEKLKQLKDTVKNYQTSLGTIGEINSASPKLAGQIAYQIPELRSAVAEYSKGANYGKK